MLDFLASTKLTILAIALESAICCTDLLACAPGLGNLSQDIKVQKNWQNRQSH